MKLFLKSFLLLFFFSFLITTAVNAQTVTPTPTKLGGMNLSGWCASINEGGAHLDTTTNTWICTGNQQPIDLTSQPTPICVWQYNVSDAYAKNSTTTSDPNYPYRWACWTNQVITPTSIPTPTVGITPTPTGIPTPTPLVTDDWATQKYNFARSSYNPNETILNASSAANIKQKLALPCSTGTCNPQSASPSGVISDAPAVVNNVMYYGDWTGNFYAKNVSDGSIIWQRNLGVMIPPAANKCNPASLGVVSSASVRTISVNNVQTPIVYIAGADGNMYALYASDGTILWKTKLADPTKGELLWDSPLEANGSVYIGVASLGDCPLVQGREYRLGWRFGDVQAMTKLVPDGCVGAGEWASPTYDQADNKIYITTGTQDNSCHFNGSLHYPEPYALAMVELDGTTLSIMGSWRIPLTEQGPDSDFGVSPQLLTATINGVPTKLVSGANKNGRLYIFKRNAVSDGPIYDLALSPNKGGTCPDCSEGTIASGVTDGITLYQPMGGCGVNSTGTEVFTNCYATGFNSAVFAINPATGVTIWRTLIPKQIVSTPILLKDMLIVFTGNNVEILARSDGHVIKTFTPPGANSILDGTGAVARGQLFFGDLNGNYYEYGF